MSTRARSVFATASASQRRAWLPIVPAFAIAFVAFAWLDRLNAPVHLSEDAVRDQLLARDCTDLGRCHLIGEAASLRGFYQGVLWPDLLIAVRLLGGDTPTERAVVLALMAVSAATVFVVVWNWLRPAVALPAALILLGVLSHDSTATTLIDEAGALLPNVLAAAGLLCFGLSGRGRFLVVSAFAVAIAINVHIAAFSLIIPLVIMASLTRPRPGHQVVVALAVLLATYLLTSSGALRANVIALAEQGRVIPGLAGGVMVAFVCDRLGSRFRRLSWDGRAFLIGLVLVVPFTLASLWLWLAERHHFSFLYLHPLMAPAAVFGAGLLAVPFELGARRVRALRWVPTLASLGVIGWIGLQGWPSARVLHGWNLAEADAITDSAARRGWSYEDLVFHLQGNACRDLLVQMSVHAPAPAPAPGDRRRQLQVVKLARAALPALADTDDVIALGPAAVAVVRDIESWLAPESLTACRVPVGTASAPSCVPALVRPAEARAPERFLFVSRSFPEVHFLDLTRPYISRYEIPLRPIAGETRDLVLTDPAVGVCGWRIVSVEGIPSEGRLPARRVRLHAGDGSAGLVVIEKPFGTPDCMTEGLADMRYPPCVFEARPDDPLLQLAEAE